MLNEHFLTLSIVKPSGERFHLARYHDIAYNSSGPDALATFVGLKVDDVFPIEYDIATIASGVPSCLRGSLHSQPNVRLSRAELIAMAI
ncbi:hypothetical protein LNV23_23865 [Paucibacter sp. DJ1R-11]|uniref:hypothetical protein n=1 Tax=Paucibacter sp. DJ1R-11 TaxID=2893556 RepID=UPI0021E37B83|nr:hypothetical protein [Paucibacter sp. DJ1R-11]MCV2366472.1 hypothetical protein [Paucibacter sp. DJ1R-11]